MLFIGGSADGQRIDVPSDRDIWKTVEKTLVPPVWDINLKVSVSAKITTYLKMHFLGNSHEFFVMAEEKLTPDDVISNLIQGYKGVEKT